VSRLFLTGLVGGGLFLGKKSGGAQDEFFAFWNWGRLWVGTVGRLLGGSRGGGEGGGGGVEMWDGRCGMGVVSCGRRIGEDDSPSCFSFFSLLSSHHHVSKIVQFQSIRYPFYL